MAVIEERKGRNGQTVYRVKIRLKGRSPVTRTFDRKTDAHIWAQDQEVQFRRERNLGTIATANKTLGEMIDRYLENELPKRRTNAGLTKTCLEWWKSELGDRKLKEISPSTLAECRDLLLRTDHKQHSYAGRAHKKKSPATVIRYMMALSHAYSVAVKEWEWVGTNPMQHVKKPQLPSSRVRFLDDEERTKLLEACEASECEYLFPVVVLALSTGARYSEIMNLRWRDIDLDRGIARLEATKNRERRALPLTHMCLDLIQRLHDRKTPDKRDLLFPRADRQAPMDIRKHWRAALRSAEIEDFRFHDLRHSAASYLAMNGATLAEIAEVLGHKTLQMVKRYAHLSDQHTASVVERMNRKIFAANDNRKTTAKKKAR